MRKGCWFHDYEHGVAKKRRKLNSYRNPDTDAPGPPGLPSLYRRKKVWEWAHPKPFSRESSKGCSYEGEIISTPFFFHIRNSPCATDVASVRRTTAHYLT